MSKNIERILTAMRCELAVLRAKQSNLDTEAYEGAGRRDFSEIMELGRKRDAIKREIEIVEDAIESLEGQFTVSA